MRYELLPVGQLNAAPYNPRKIKPEAREKLKASLIAFDVVDPIIVNERTGFTVIGGHQRLEIVRELGRETVPCVIVDIERDREVLLNIALNNKNLMGEFDFGKMADLLLDCDARNLDTTLTGFSDDELTRMMEWSQGLEATEPSTIVNPDAFSLVVKCRSEQEQGELLSRLAAEGLNVRAMV